MANLYTTTWNPYQNLGHVGGFGASLWTDYAPAASWAGYGQMVGAWQYAVAAAACKQMSDTAVARGGLPIDCSPEAIVERQRQAVIAQTPISPAIPQPAQNVGPATMPTPAPLLTDTTRKTLNWVLAGGAILASWWAWEKFFYAPRRARGIRAWELWKQ